MSFSITGESVSISKKTGNSTDVMNINSCNPLSINKVRVIDTGNNSDMSLKRNGVEMIKLGNDGSDYIDFKNKEIRNMTASTISELSGDLTINDSLQIGTGSGCKLSTTGTPSQNLVVNVNTGKQINLSVNNTAQAYVDSNGLTIASANVNFVSTACNITQSSGNMQMRVATSKTISNQVNGVDSFIVSGNNVNIPTGSTYNINGSSVLSNNTLGSGVTASSLTSVGTLTSLNTGAITCTGTSNVFGSGNASALTVSQDGTNTIYNVPTSKSHKLQVAGSDKLYITSSSLTAYGALGIADSTESSSISSGSITTNGGVGIAKKLYVNGSAGSGSLFTVDSAYGSNALTCTLAAGTTSNSDVALRMKPNYTGTTLNGFQTYAEYGDNGNNNNRNNSSLYIQQYIQDVNGGTAVNAYETRQSFGSRREVRFSTTGGSTNDIVFDGTNATFSGVNVAIGSGKSLTLSSDLAVKPTTNTWTISSDGRLKENIEDVKTKDALSAINSIKIRQFDYIQDFKNKYHISEHKKVGVIAQELESHDLLKPCVSIGEDEVFYEEQDEEYVDDIDGQTKTRKIQVEKSRISQRKQVNMDRVNYLLIGAIQELNKQNAYLLTKLKDKEQQIIDINERLNQLETSYQNRTNENVFDTQSYTGNVGDNFSVIG